MRNLGSADENMAARFPIAASDGRSNYPELKNLLVKVDGKTVQSRRVDYPEIGQEASGNLVTWAEFDIAFPAGKDVAIRVEYDLQGTGYYPFTAFYYILTTGAGWKDTIGSADIILRLPYEASPQNVILDFEIGWGTTTSGGVMQGNEVRWHFEDFEPEQNMEFVMVAPAAWQNVLTARDNAEKHPSDGEAWGMLGKTYKSILQPKGPREDVGGEQVYQLSVEAYEKCLELKPDDAQWHAGFADLLASHVMWDYYGINTDPTTYRALNEMQTALKLAPNDPVVRRVASDMVYKINGGIAQVDNEFVFPWLTQTPTPFPPTLEVVISEDATSTPPSPAPTEVNAPQAGPTRTEVPAATPTSTPQRSAPLCGSAALLPLVATAWFVWKRK
jgi:hypothetical protein